MRLSNVSNYVGGDDDDSWHTFFLISFSTVEYSFSHNIFKETNVHVIIKQVCQEINQIWKHNTSQTIII